MEQRLKQELQHEFKLLVETQRQMSVLQTFIYEDENSRAAHELPDVWNAMLDLRYVLIRNIVNNPILNDHGLLKEFCSEASKHLND